MTGTKLRRASWDGGAKLMHWCPGCEGVHGYIIEGGPPTWSFNGDFAAPSFNPSMLIYVTHTTDDDDKPLAQPRRETLCHYFIRTGAELQNREAGRVFDPAKSYIDFCGDSPHKLAGQVVELPDWPYAPGTYGGIDEAEA